MKNNNEKLLELLRHSFLNTRKLMHNQEKPFGNLGMLHLLVHKFPEGAKPSDIAKYDGISLPTVSQKISALEEQGFIERHNSKEDRRVTLVKATDKGVEKIKGQYQYFLNEFSYVRKNMSDESIEKLVELLDELNNNLIKYHKSKEKKD